MSDQFSQIPQDQMERYAAMLNGGATEPDPQVPQSPTAPTAPQILDQQTIAALAKKGMETKQEAFNRLRETFYGVKEGEEPTTKRKIGKRFPEVLKALFQGNYEAPEDKWRDRVNKNFPDETQRMQGVLGPLERMQTAQTTLQQQMAMKQQQLDALTARADADRELKKTKEQHADTARQALSEYRTNRAKSLGNLDAQRANEASAHTAILQYKVKHPDVTPGQLFDDLSKGMTDPMDKAELWNFINHPGAGVGTSTSSTSTTNDATGVTTTNSQRSKNLTAPRNAISDAFSRMGVPQFAAPSQGAGENPVQPPAAQSTPVAPAMPTRPMVTPAAPAAQPSLAGAAKTVAPPGAVVLEDGSYSNNPVDQADYRNPFVNPNEGKGLVASRKKAATDAAAMAKKTEAFETLSGGALDTSIRALLNGNAAKYQGPVSGNPIAIAIRKMFGTNSDEETRSMLNNIDMLYNKLGINIRGRFTSPEIAGHLQTMGNLSASPENSIKAVAALKLQAELGRLEAAGRLRGLKVEDVNYLITNEMKRLSGEIDKAKLSTVAGRPLNDNAPTPNNLRLRSVTDLINEARTNKALGNLSPEQKAAKLREELTRRGVK